MTENSSAYGFNGSKARGSRLFERPRIEDTCILLVYLIYIIYSPSFLFLLEHIFLHIPLFLTRIRVLHSCL